MASELNPTLVQTGDGDVVKEVDEVLIESIWRDLGGQVTRERIRQVAATVAAEFRDVMETTFLPIFIQRRTRERLEDEVGKTTVR